ncbi:MULTISPECIES: MBL fold metallo-hydrolase [Terrabacteria group]|uniref:MBL fold metallo-hydrolase n=1 Tax=Bacillati TaxID=1783272 RepID=UPI001C6E306A|nr:MULTISPECIES: MBL fold metallo-hydrolase [Terrabacteria group]MBW9212617.1 MBL fold metallo-hydrolase [Trueperella sp. zg.1013]
MMKYTLICSGSKGNSFYLEDDSTHILVDCGSSKKRILTGLHNFGADEKDLDAVLITHSHSDHIAAVSAFKDYPIYSPVELEDIDVFLVDADKSFTIETLRIMPIALSHDAGKTVGYVFDNGIERLLYMTDTGYLNEKYFSYLKGMDYIIIESNHDVEMLMKTNRPHYLKRRILDDEGHLNNEDCATILERIVTANTKYIWLAHLSQEANTPELALRTTVETLNRMGLENTIQVAVAEQFRALQKGGMDEEMDFGNYCATVCMESRF